MAGTIKNGSGLSDTGIGNVTRWTFGNSTSKCTVSSGLTLMSQGLNAIASINFVSFSNGVVSGNVSGIDITFSGSDLFGTCTFRITRSANFSYAGDPWNVTSP